MLKRIALLASVMALLAALLCAQTGIPGLGIVEKGSQTAFQTLQVFKLGSAESDKTPREK